MSISFSSFYSHDHETTHMTSGHTSPSQLALLGEEEEDDDEEEDEEEEEECFVNLAESDGTSWWRRRNL